MPVRSADRTVRHLHPTHLPGRIGIAAGLLFIAMSIWEHAAGLDPGRHTPAGVVNQLGFAVALTGYAVLGLGLVRARPAADRKGVTLFPAVLAAAWIALAGGDLLQLVTPLTPDADPLNILGGLGQAIGLAGLGITVALAAQWKGWRRYWPLGVAGVYVGVLLVPALIGIAPSATTETVWALGISGLGLALATASP
jgi:hypothetical protein